MAEDLFRVMKGVSLNDNADIIYGSADPSAGGGVASPIGSIYCKTDDGAIWHKVGSGDTAWNKLVDSAGASTEDGYQNTFMGKDSTGSILPDYSSTNHIADNDSLETAIGKLDAELGAAITGEETRTFAPISDQAINLNILALDNAIGSDAEHANSDHTTVNASINTKISELDGALSAEVYKKSETNVTAPSSYAADSVSASTYSMISWMIRINSNTTPANMQGYRITAMTDGTNVDDTKYSILKLGSAITGLSVAVAINTGNMELELNASENIDYSLVRTVIA